MSEEMTEVVSSTIQQIREQILDDVGSCLVEFLACVGDSGYDRRLSIDVRQIRIESIPEWNGDTGCVTVDLVGFPSPSATNIALLLDDDVLQLISRRIEAEVTACLRLRIYCESWVLK